MADGTKYEGVGMGSDVSANIFLRDIALALSCKYASKQIEPPTETSAYASGDVLFAPIEIENVSLFDGESVLLDALKLIDDDELREAIDLIFLKSNVSLGTVNAAATVPSGAEYLGTVKIVAADYTDLGDISVAEKKNVNEIFATADTSKSIWVAGVARAAMTYTSTSGLSLILNFKRS